MDCGAPDADIFLTDRIGDDVNIVTHVDQCIRHLPNTRGGAVVGRERASRHHRDRVAVLSGSMLRGDVGHGAVVAGVVERTGFTGFLR
jgi:hypothetical protein